MVDLFLLAFVLGLLALGTKRPFLWVLAYLYIDIVAPQKISYFLLASIPISLIVFALAFLGWMKDDKRDSRFTMRQALIVMLFLWCGYTTLLADFPVEAAAKWSWVWKALVFAIFLPLTLRTRLRLEATALVLVLSAASIIITGGIKTALGGGGYGTLKLLVNDNTGLYESSIISCMAVAIIPLILWLVNHGTIFPRDWRVRLFAAALCFACLLIPVGTEARTGLVCIAVLILLMLRTAKRRVLYGGLMAVAAMAAIPFLPASFTARMDTIENHKTDESASSRIAIWKWTWEYVQDHPFGGGFDAYRANSFRYKIAPTPGTGGAEPEQRYVVDKARAYHSSYFEMLGEQGFLGLGLWLLLQLLGILQMELVRRRWKKRTGENERWQAPLANALQIAHVIYMVGSLFVGIAFQPFVYMLIGLQCGLWSYLRRIETPDVRRAPRTMKPLAVPNTIAAS